MPFSGTWWYGWIKRIETNNELEEQNPIALPLVFTALVNSEYGELESTRDRSKQEMLTLVHVRSKYAHL